MYFLLDTNYNAEIPGWLAPLARVSPNILETQIHSTTGCYVVLTWGQ